MKKAIASAAALLVTVVVAAGCAATSASTPLPLDQSSSYYNFIQPTFSSYLDSTKQWLSANRTYISSNPEREIAFNMPFELEAQKTAGKPTDKAILLVHGLGDSPYSFSDLGPTLAEQGFHVQTLLLPGHGSKPEDLMSASYADWQKIVDHYATLLKQDYPQVWLGGFSTGANLVTIHAIEKQGIEGLMLFSPGFVSRTPRLEKLAPLASLFYDGYKAEERNIARYTSAPLKGAIAYSDSASRLREVVKKGVKVKTLIAVAEADSIIDPDAIRDIYQTNFTHPDNQLLWYGETAFHDPSIKSMTMRLPSVKFSTGSHMNPLFAPSNPYYGQRGERRMCMNSFDSDATKRCEAGEEVWYSAWGYEEKGKIHARSTWNPYYADLEQRIHQMSE